MKVFLDIIFTHQHKIIAHYNIMIVTLHTITINVDANVFGIGLDSLL